MNKFKYDLGLKAKDVVTGFEGIIISRTNHLTGCNTYALKPVGSDKDGAPKSAFFFDENEIEITSQGVKKKIEKLSEAILPGGPREIPKNSRN